MEPELYYYYGIFLAQIDAPSSEVIESLGRAAVLQARYVQELLMYGGRKFYSNRFAGAIEANQRILAIDPSYHLAWYNIAISHAFAGDVDDALAALDRAESGSKTFDIGIRTLDYEKLRQLVVDGSSFDYQIEFSYVFDYVSSQQRVDTKQFSRIPDLLGRS